MEKIYNSLVEVVKGLEETSRGAGGFGFIGINEVRLENKDKKMNEQEMIIIEQQWPYESPGWEQEEGRVTLCAGKTHHIRLGGMKWVYLP